MASLSPYKENGIWWTVCHRQRFNSVALYVYISILIYRYIYRGWTKRNSNLAVENIALPWKASKPKETGFCPTPAQHLVPVCPASRLSDSLDIKTEWVRFSFFENGK